MRVGKEEYINVWLTHAECRALLVELLVCSESKYARRWREQLTLLFRGRGEVCLPLSNQDQRAFKLLSGGSTITAIQAVL